MDLASHDAYIKKHSSSISGGVAAGPDPSGMRPRHEYRDNSQNTYHDAKDEGQPKESRKTAAELAPLIAAVKTASNTKRLLETAFETGKGAAKRNAKRKAARIAKAKRVAAAATTTVGVGGVVANQVSESKKPKKSALKIVKIVKLAAEAGMSVNGYVSKLAALQFSTPPGSTFSTKYSPAQQQQIKGIMAQMVRRRRPAVGAPKVAADPGMSVEDYVGAEQQANQEMEQNELGHVRQVAEQATQQAQALSERAMQAEQQLQGVQQQLQQSQQQGQMAMQQASDSEANAAEQANAKLRMKMKIDQMRQTLADLAAVNPQMDEAPGPEAGMPQPGAPPGPVLQQADAAQQAAQQPQTAEQAKQMQQAQTAQNKAQEQTAQAQQAQQQGQMGAAQVPMNAGAQGAPAAQPVM